MGISKKIFLDRPPLLSRSYAWYTFRTSDKDLLQNEGLTFIIRIFWITYVCTSQSDRSDISNQGNRACAINFLTRNIFYRYITNLIIITNIVGRICH